MEHDNQDVDQREVSRDDIPDTPENLKTDGIEHGHMCPCGEVFESEDAHERHIERERFEPPTGWGLYREAENVREPTEEEIHEIIEAFQREGHGGDREDVHSQVVAPSYIVVMEGYQTGGPGYYGKLVVLIGEGGPSMYYVMRERHEDEGLVLVEQGGGM